MRSSFFNSEANKAAAVSVLPRITVARRDKPCRSLASLTSAVVLTTESLKCPSLVIPLTIRSLNKKSSLVILMIIFERWLNAVLQVGYSLN